MRRRLLKLTHPDSCAGDHDLFIWTDALCEHVAADRLEDAGVRHHHDDDGRHGDDGDHGRQHCHREPPPHPRTGERIPFETAFEHEGFTTLNSHAIHRAVAVDEPYARLLRHLRDCYEAGSEAAEDAALYRAPRVGVTHKQLACIAHLSGMTGAERIRWYRIAESVPLSQRHAGHIIARLHAKAGGGR
jgi:hypothetical protein